MSVEHLSAVLHHSRATGAAKVILIGIANHAGDGGSWPSVATLARYANVNHRNAQAAIKRLEDLGEVARHVQAGGTDKSHDRSYDRPNLYEVLVECPEGCAGGPNHRARAGWRRLRDGSYVPTSPPVASDTPSPLSPTTPPVASDPPPPVASDTQTIPSTSANKVPSQVQTAREDRPTFTERVVASLERPLGSDVMPLDTRPCEECSAPDERQCLRRQMRLPTDSRHPYTPLAPQPRRATAGAHGDQQQTDKKRGASGAGSNDGKASE